MYMLIPEMMPLATFATHIYLGGTLDYITCLGAMDIFGRLQGPVREAPHMLREFQDFKDDMKQV
jgi:ABC-type multidrug transport system fused ATPase/permease subunit